MVDYYQYIASAEWYARTEQVRLRNNGVCEICNLRYATEVHHRSYQNLGNERDEELLSICHYCHGVIHNKVELRRRYFVFQGCIKQLLELKKEAEQNVRAKS